VNLKNNIQSNKKEHPFDFLIALKSLLSELKARNLYEDVSFCFVRLARSVTLFSLRTADQETESIIIRKLVNEKFYHEILINSEPLDDRNIELIERRTRKEQFISRISGSLPIDETVICGKVNQPLCSVIIPVYNTEKYLDKCLSSIRKQTENNLEIICVNDGSEDGSLDILKKHAATDPRITVVSQQNSGLSCARNTGIKHATGQYIYFMDSDDVLREDAIKILTQLMLDKNLDTVFFDADTFYDEQVTDEEKKSIYNPSYRRNHEYEGVYSGRTIADEMIRNQEYYVSACLQINRREFLTEHKNYFEPWILYEDNPFTFRNILYAERVSYINEPFFQRRIRKNSIMTTKRTYLNSYSYFICYMRMMKELLNYNATEPVPDTLLQLPDNVLYSSRDIYMKLSEDDQFGDEFLTGLTRGLFRKEIVDYCRNLKEHSELSRTCEEMKEESEIMKSEIEKQKDEIRFNQMLYRDMKNSLSFKIGSATTAVPRKIRDLLKMIIK